MERKEKLMLFRQLQDEAQAEKDLELLSKLNPAHKDLPRFARKPRYYAAHILYALLDVCCKDDITNNRKPVEEDGSSKTSMDDSSKALTNDNADGEVQVPDDGDLVKNPNESSASEGESPADDKKQETGEKAPPSVEEEQEASKNEPVDDAPPEESPSEDSKKK